MKKTISFNLYAVRVGSASGTLGLTKQSERDIDLSAESLLKIHSGEVQVPLLWSGQCVYTLKKGVLK